MRITQLKSSSDAAGRKGITGITRSTRAGKKERREKPHPRLQGFPTAKRGKQGRKREFYWGRELGERAGARDRLLPYTRVFIILLIRAWSVSRSGGLPEVGRGGG